MSGDVAYLEPDTRCINRRSVLQCATASIIASPACTLVDDAVMRPGLINARNIHNIAWNQDGTRLAGSDAPRSFIAVWDAHSGASIWRHDFPTATASGPVAFADRSTLITFSDPRGVLTPGSLVPLLDSGSGQVQGDLNAVTAGRLANAPVTCLASSDDERLVAVAYRQQAHIDVVDFADTTTVARLGPVIDGLGRTGSTISFICLSPDNAYVAIGFTWGEAQIWDIRTNYCIARLAVYGNTSLRGLAFAGPTTLVTCSDGIRSVPTRQIIKLPGYRWAPAEADLPEAAVRVWSILSGDFIRSLKMQDESGTNGIAATSTGSLAACVSRAKRLHVWRVADGALVNTRQLPFVSALDPDGDIRFSPDGTRVAAAASSSLFVESLV